MSDCLFFLAAAGFSLVVSVGCLVCMVVRPYREIYAWAACQIATVLIAALFIDFALRSLCHV